MRPIACRGAELIDYQASCKRSCRGFPSPPQMMQRIIPHLHLRGDGPPLHFTESSLRTYLFAQLAVQFLPQEARRLGNQAAKCRRFIRGTLVNSALGALPFDAMHLMMVHYSILLGGTTDRAKKKNFDLALVLKRACLPL